MSITKTEMYFEMDEENEENKKLDAQVLTLCLCLTCVSPGKSNQLIQVFCAKGKCVGNQVSAFLKRMADILRWFVQDIGNTEVDSGWKGGCNDTNPYNFTAGHLGGFLEQ